MMSETPSGNEQETTPEGFTFENEYSFVNRISSLNNSISIENNLTETKLKLVLEAASPEVPEPAAAAGPQDAPDTPVLEFPKPTQDNPGVAALKVIPSAAGIVFTNEDGALTRLAPPERASVLIFEGGRPKWFPIPDPESDCLLGRDQENKWKWYEDLELAWNSNASPEA